MPRIPWSEHVSNDEDVEKMKPKKRGILNIKKRQWKFLSDLMRKKGIAYMIHT